MATKAYSGDIDFNITNVPSYYDYSIVKDYQYLDQYDGITYRAIKVIADSLATYEPILEEKKDKEWIEIEDNALIRDLNRFNGFQTLSDARRLTLTQKRLTGNAYWLIRTCDERGHDYEFYILDPTRVAVNTGRSGLPTEYVYTDRNGKRVEFESTDIIHFQEINPKSMVKGYSSIDASRYSHFTHEMIRRGQLNQFGNLFPKGVLVYGGGNDSSAPSLKSEENKNRLAQWLSTKFSGIRNLGKTPVLSTDVKWVQIGQTNKELDFQGSVGDIRDEILAIQGVPKPMLGFPDSTYTNAKEMQTIFQKNTLRPELMGEASVYTEQLIPKYYSGIKDTNSLRFRFDDPVEPDKADMASIMIDAWRSGAISKADVREFLELEVQDGEDEIYRTDLTNRVNEDVVEDLKSIKKMVKSIPQLKERMEEERLKLKQFFDERGYEEEKNMAYDLNRYFLEQGSRVIKENTKSKKTVTKAFVLKTEEAIAIEFFKNLYLNQATIWNQVAGSLIDDQAKLTNEQIKLTDERLEYFANEVNVVTRDKVRTVIGDSITLGRTEEETAKELVNVFAGYVDGVDNLEFLSRQGVYIPPLEVDGTRVSDNSKRLKDMFNLIEGAEMDDTDRLRSYQSLYGISRDVDETITDATAAKIRQLNGNFVNVTERRATTIARTEVHAIKNAVSRSRYETSDSVVALEWLSAGDGDTREAHLEADGQQVPKGSSFRVGGEWLEYPGDSNGSAGNTINCRCTTIPVVE